MPPLAKTVEIQAFLAKFNKIGTKKPNPKQLLKLFGPTEHQHLLILRLRDDAKFETKTSSNPLGLPKTLNQLLLDLFDKKLLLKAVPLIDVGWPLFAGINALTPNAIKWKSLGAEQLQLDTQPNAAEKFIARTGSIPSPAWIQSMRTKLFLVCQRGKAELVRKSLESNRSTKFAETVPIQKIPENFSVRPRGKRVPLSWDLPDNTKQIDDLKKALPSLRIGPIRIVNYSDPAWGKDYTQYNEFIANLIPKDLNGFPGIAVLDSGISIDHPALQNSYIKAESFYMSSRTMDDPTGHGTAVAGILVGKEYGNWVNRPSKPINNIEFLTHSGLLPDLQIYPFRVLSTGTGGDLDVPIGEIHPRLYYSAMDCILYDPRLANIKVLNLSLFSTSPVAGSGDSANLESEYILELEKANKVVVACCGNHATEKEPMLPYLPMTVTYPASYPTVISVGALAADGKVTGFSNYTLPLGTPPGNPKIVSDRFYWFRSNDEKISSPKGGSDNTDQLGHVSMVAPGKNFLTCTKATQYTQPPSKMPLAADYDNGSGYVLGTSFAAPFVTAAAAIVLAHKPSLSPAEVRSLLAKSTEGVDIDKSLNENNEETTVDPYRSGAGVISFELLSKHLLAPKSDLDNAERQKKPKKKG